MNYYQDKWAKIGINRVQTSKHVLVISSSPSKGSPPPSSSSFTELFVFVVSTVAEVSFVVGSASCEVFDGVLLSSFSAGLDGDGVVNRSDLYNLRDNTCFSDNR